MARLPFVLSALSLMVLAGTAACTVEERNAGVPPTVAPVAADARSLAGLPAQVQALHSRCVDAMVRSACVAEADRSTEPKQSAVVMVAGVGAVDSKFYDRLRFAGDRMCGEILETCHEDWQGAECKTARALWPESVG